VAHAVQPAAGADRLLLEVHGNPHVKEPLARFLAAVFWFFAVAHFAFGIAGTVFPRWFYAALPLWPPLHVGQIQIAGVFDLALAVLFSIAATDIARYLPIVVPCGVVAECGHALVRIGHVRAGDNSRNDLLAPIVMLLFGLMLLGIGVVIWVRSRSSRPIWGDRP
jgi:hypothetical protein